MNRFFYNWINCKNNYINFSDEGEKFYYGEKKFIRGRTSKNVYKSNINLSQSESE